MAYCYVCRQGFDRPHDCTDGGKCPRCGQPGNTKPEGYVPTEQERVMDEPGTASFCYPCGKYFSAFYEEDGALRCPDCGWNAGGGGDKLLRLEGVDGFEGIWVVRSKKYDPETDTTTMVMTRKGE